MPTGATPRRPAWPSTSSCKRGGRRCSGPRPGLPPAATAGRSAAASPSPDERLEADPLAELTVEEAAAAESGTVEEGDDAAGLASAGHPFEVLAEADITPEEAQASEEDDDDEPAPEPSPGIHLERDDRTR